MVVVRVQNQTLYPICFDFIKPTLFQMRIILQPHHPVKNLHGKETVTVMT